MSDTHPAMLITLPLEYRRTIADVASSQKAIIHYDNIGSVLDDACCAGTIWHSECAGSRREI